MKRRFGWLALLLITACADPHARTQVMLELDAECGLLADADSIVLRVQGPDGEPSVITLEPSAAGPLPRRVPLLPAGDDANRTFLVEADLRSGALTLATVRAASGYRRGETLGLRLLFDDACRAHVCGATETCRAGTCESAARPPSSLSTFAQGRARLRRGGRERRRSRGRGPGRLDGRIDGRRPCARAGRGLWVLARMRDHERRRAALLGHQRFHGAGGRHHAQA